MICRKFPYESSPASRIFRPYQLHLAPQALAAATCSTGQEIVDQPGEFRRLFHLRHVTEILDDGEPRARDGTLIDFATLDGRDRIRVPTPAMSACGRRAADGAV
jgi:hypothetical protein